MTSKRHFQGRYLAIDERDRWEFATRTNSSGVVVILPVTASGELLFVEQFRIPVNNRVIEFPAGLAGDHGDADEPFAQAAERELLEETGYQAARMRWLIRCPSSPGMSDEQLDFFLAEDVTRVGPGGGDDSEDITVHVVPVDQVDEWLATMQRAGKTFDPKIYTGLYWLERRDRLDLILPSARD